MKIKLISEIKIGENVGTKERRDEKSESEKECLRCFDVFSLIIFS